MKRLFLYVLILLSVAAKAQNDGLSVENAPVADDVPLGQLVTTRLDALIGEMQQRDSLLDTSQLGLMVWDLTADSLLYAYGPRQLLRPASTMKLVTSITALDRLGVDYRFHTSLYYKGTISQGTLRGDLVCVGGMDPLFGQSDMQAFAQALKQIGVKSVQGRIVCDVTMKNADKWGEGWCWDDDNPTLTPLLVKKKSDFAAQLTKELRNARLTVNATVVTAPLPQGATHVSTQYHSIDEVLHEMMKESDNLFAESTFYQVAASTGRRPATAEDGVRVEQQLLSKLGLDIERLRLADGSGLSLYNYVTAETLVRLLRYAWQQHELYAHLLPSLPIAGEDGTLKRRMKGTAAQSNVQAKTGSVSGISSLAGYCTASAGGHRLCFAIINQGVRRMAEGRHFQDRVCEALCAPAAF
ncbi:MAG: D-alanyl-D-alanine carboxypeptidase/D-alanyl-D-alanine-endopeptidase [Prevotella sp.]|nr:D-alanyl-D-alanine carboxypeptidase/D-alanyl-D-alanine-endopeptidase [Prevotella sp.]